MRTTLILTLTWVLACPGLTTEAMAETPRREPIGAFLGGTLPGTPPVPSGDWVTRKAFPKLTFEDPVGLVAGPSGSRTLFVWGRQGVVWSFENDPNASTKTVVLDIQTRCQGWDDGGLLGLALHPRFGQAGAADRGLLYVWYTFSERPNPGPGRPENGRPTRNRLSRFMIPDGTALVDPKSELVLIDQLDENTYHNGGGMFFHPVNGFLYLSLGDEGGDSGANTQRIDRDLFSGVIRIDVDCRGGTVSHAINRQPESGKTAHYFIPNDNPWVGLGGVLEEFWAVGLRSPHRMTHDAKTGRTWVGDVGESTREEVDIIERAGNYQWGFREGTANAPQGRPAKVLGIETPPVFEYGRDQGNAVIGGYVYRGTEHAASLGGKYVFGDNNGRIWALTYDQGPPRAEHLCDLPQAPSRAYGLGLSSFGVDQAGELFLCQLGTEGQIYRLGRKEKDHGNLATKGTSFPERLSETGAFRDLKTLTPAAFLIPYEVNSPLWADGAVKRRWVAVPNDGAPYGKAERIGFAESGPWTFPEGTVFVKHFEIATDETQPASRRRLETRFLIRSVGGGVHGATYRWRPDQADADLVGVDGDDASIEVKTAKGSRRQTWHYPGRRECLSCHTEAAGLVLGLNTRQLNRENASDDETLRVWDRLDLFDRSPEAASPRRLPRLVAADDPKATLEERVRSYLDANCAHCHRPGGVRATFDARYEAAEQDRRMIDGNVANALGRTDARVIAPGSLSKSIAYQRMTSLKANERMPPLASSVVDDEAAAVLKSWIEGLPRSIRDPKGRSQ